MENPVRLISIVIPLYNKELYIQRTLDSVLSQTHTNFECIVVDSSNDNSTEIVKKYSDPRICHILSKPRSSHSNARNLGIKMAKSDLIAFLDADDEWAPDHLEALSSLHQKYPDAGVFTTPYIKILNTGLPKAMIFAEIPPPPWEGYIPRYFLTCSKGDVPIHSSGCAINKRVFHEIGGFDETLIDVGEDQHLWARIALDYPVAFTWKGPILYHTEASGRICNEPREEIIPDPLNHYLEEIIDSGNISPELRNDIQAYISKRNKMLFLSRILQLTIQSSSGNSIQKPKNLVVNLLSSLGFSKMLNQAILSLYNSRFYNRCIVLWCNLHGWHVPIIV